MMCLLQAPQNVLSFHQLLLPEILIDKNDLLRLSLEDTLPFLVAGFVESML